MIPNQEHRHNFHLKISPLSTFSLIFLKGRAWAVGISSQKERGRKSKWKRMRETQNEVNWCCSRASARCLKKKKKIFDEGKRLRLQIRLIHQRDVWDKSGRVREMKREEQRKGRGDTWRILDFYSEGCEIRSYLTVSPGIPSQPTTNRSQEIGRRHRSA